MNQTGHMVLATEHPSNMVALVTIETGERLLTLRADLVSWRNVPPAVKEQDTRVVFDHEDGSLLSINLLGASIGQYAAQRYPRFDRGETWQTVRRA